MQTVKQYCVCGRGFVTLFWNSKCISFRQLKRWVYWGLSLNSSKYTYCVCVHHSQQQQSAPSCTVGCPCSPCPAVAGSPMMQLHQFIHPDLCTCHIQFTPTFESEHETPSLNTGGWPAFCVGDVCRGGGVCLCDFVIIKVSDRAALFTEFGSFISCLPRPMRISNKRQHSQIWKETNWEALCQCVC